jgi:hypothetical protein
MEECKPLVAGVVHATTSLIAKEPNTSVYVVNKWDFLRLVGDVPGCDTFEVGLMDSARHVIKCILDPRSLSGMESHDVASTIHQSLVRGLPAARGGV